MSEPEANGASQLGIELIRQIDAVCRRFETDWRAGARPTFDSYLAEVPEHARPALRAELEAMELELRRSKERVARVELGSAAEVLTITPAASPTQPTPDVALASIYEEPTIAPGDPATTYQEPGSTGEATEPSRRAFVTLVTTRSSGRSPAVAWASCMRRGKWA